MGKVLHISAKVQPMKPPSKEPHRTIVASTYCRPVDTAVLLDHLRCAHLLKEKLGEPYSFEAAVLSLWLDMDPKGITGGVVKGKSDYERIWGWTARQVRTRWQQMHDRINELSTAYGRLSTDEAATKQRRSSDDKQPDSDEKSQGSDDVETKQRRSSDEHTKQLATQQEEIPSAASPREADFNRFLLGNGYPSEAEVRQWATEAGHDPPECWDIAESLRAIGYKNAKQIPYEQWDWAIEDWLKYRKKFPDKGKSNGASKQASTGSARANEKPESSYEARLRYGRTPIDQAAFERSIANLEAEFGSGDDSG